MWWPPYNLDGEDEPFFYTQQRTMNPGHAMGCGCEDCMYGPLSDDKPDTLTLPAFKRGEAAQVYELRRMFRL